MIEANVLSRHLFRRCVPTAIELDDELASRAHEVGNEGTDGMLTAELCIEESPVSDAVPEDGLGIGGVISERA